MGASFKDWFKFHQPFESRFHTYIHTGRDESWWFTSPQQFWVVFPQISPKNKWLKNFPKVSQKKIPKNFPKFPQKKSAKVLQLWLQFHPKKAKFFEISLTNLTEAAMAVKESAGDLDGPWEEHPNGLIFAKKNRSRRKMGSFFSFYFCIAGRSFFWKLGPGVYYSGVNFNLYMI